MAPSSIFLGESEIDSRYFDYFQQTAAQGLDSAWDWPIWNRLVLQNSHHEPFVRQSIIAIGALLKAQEEAMPTGMPPHVVPSKATLHRNFAIAKYDAAVKQMRKVLCAGTNNPRQALIGCIFVIFFELLMGNRHLATWHAQSGTMILQQWRTKTMALEENAQRPRLLSPAPLTVEDEIVAAFHGLDIQLATISDCRRAACYEEMVNDYRVAISSLPATFTDLQEARIYLILIMRRICHFIAMTRRPAETVALAKRFDNEPPSEFSTSTDMSIHGTSFKVTEDDQAKQTQFGADIASWERVFAPLLKRSLTKVRCEVPSDINTYIAAARLQIQCIATRILTAGVVITNEMEYDKFNPQFLELVDLATVVVALSRRRCDMQGIHAGFWLDSGIFPQLVVVANRCQDPIIQRRAIKLLGGWHIEGSWDAPMIVHIRILIIELEEEALEDIKQSGTKGVIPENVRAVFSRLSTDSQNGTDSLAAMCD